MRVRTKDLRVSVGPPGPNSVAISFTDGRDVNVEVFVRLVVAELLNDRVIDALKACTAEAFNCGYEQAQADIRSALGAAREE